MQRAKTWRCELIEQAQANVCTTIHGSEIYLMNLTYFSRSAAAFVLLFLGACSGASQEHSIVIEKEVVLTGISGGANAITRTVDGGFVIVGARGVGWAAGTTADGALKWKYEESLDPGVKTQYQSEFYSVVPLNDGGALLCGEISTREHAGRLGLIVRVDSMGHVLERRTDFPGGTDNVELSSVNSCIPWREGFAAIGMVTAGRRGFIWVSKLDSKGSKEWDKADADLPGISGVATADGDLVLVGSANADAGIRVARFDPTGNRLSERNLDFSEAILVRSAEPITAVRLVAVDQRFRNTLVSLNADLKDANSNNVVGPPFVRDGRAYSLSDGSVALFGSLSGSIIRSAIGRVARHGKQDEVRVMNVPNPGDSSVSVKDAIPIAIDKFVTIRDQSSSVNPSNTGIVLTWVTFN
jgi:hypothetical protein